MEICVSESVKPVLRWIFFVVLPLLSMRLLHEEVGRRDGEVLRWMCLCLHIFLFVRVHAPVQMQTALGMWL